MSEQVGSRGPILGNDECKHEERRWYNGIEGVYAVCQQCGAHFWDDDPPSGVEIVDLNG